MNLKIIRNINFFADNFSEKFLIHMCKQLEEKKYGPEEAVFTKDSSSDKLFIFNSGEVSLYIELANGNKRKSIKILETIKVKYGIGDLSLEYSLLSWFSLFCY